jgi:hypothetical protein
MEFYLADRMNALRNLHRIRPFPQSVEMREFYIADTRNAESRTLQQQQVIRSFRKIEWLNVLTDGRCRNQFSVIGSRISTELGPFPNLHRITPVPLINAIIRHPTL